MRAARGRITDPFGEDYDDLSCYDDGDMVDLVGPDEVAEMLGVKRNTIAQWRFRKLLSEPELVLSQIPIWKRSEIIEWAKLTGRTIVERSEV